LGRGIVNGPSWGAWKNAATKPSDRSCGYADKSRKEEGRKVSLQEPDCGAVLDRVAEKVGPVDSPHEAEYRALIRGLKLAAEKRLPYIAAFSDSANVVNQITGTWNKNERAIELYEEVEEALEPFKTWQLSWIPREMNRDADKLVDQAFQGEPVTHATD
jgi:ribonuclease HI